MPKSEVFIGTTITPGNQRSFKVPWVCQRSQGPQRLGSTVVHINGPFTLKKEKEVADAIMTQIGLRVEDDSFDILGWYEFERAEG